MQRIEDSAIEELVLLNTMPIPKEKMLESCLEILDSKLTSRDSATERYFIQPYLVSRKSVKNRKEK